MILNLPNCFVRPTEGVETDGVKGQSGCCHVYTSKCTLTKFFGMAGRDRVANRPNRQLTVREASRVVTLLREGHLQRSIARELGVSPNAVSKLWKIFRGSQHGSGRRRKTTPSEDIAQERTVNCNRAIGMVHAKG